MTCGPKAAPAPEIPRTTRRATAIGQRRRRGAGAGLGPRSMASIASTTARADAGREEGSRASSDVMSAEAAGGSPGLSRSGGSGVATASAVRIAIASGPSKGSSARGHLIEDATEAEEVAERRDRAAAGLLGAHVVRRAGDLVGLAPVGVRLQAPRQAEVEDLHPAATAFEPEVRRLDVAVHQAAPMRDVQPFGDLAGDPEGLGQGELPFAAEAVGEGLALQEGHRQEEDPAILGRLIDRDDVVVVERGDGPGLAEEPPPRLRAGRERPLHHLQGDRPSSGAGPRPGRRSPCPPRRSAP